VRGLRALSRVDVAGPPDSAKSSSNHKMAAASVPRSSPSARNAAKRSARPSRPAGTRATGRCSKKTTTFEKIFCVRVEIFLLENGLWIFTLSTDTRAWLYLYLSNKNLINLHLAKRKTKFFIWHKENYLPTSNQLILLLKRYRKQNLYPAIYIYCIMYTSAIVELVGMSYEIFIHWPQLERFYRPLILWYEVLWKIFARESQL